MFEFTLAERLGRTVAELRRTMSTAEYAEWVALDEVRAYWREQAIKAAER